MSDSLEPHCTGPILNLVLASASPRRIALLQSVGLSFTVDPADIDESVPDGTPPETAVTQLALRKARAVGERHPDALTVAADTLVEYNGRLLGKPRDLNDARTMLRNLKGATHRVFTGLALFDAGNGSIATRVGVTTIKLRSIDDREIEAYLRTTEPYDKASALAVQGLGGVFLEHMDGEFSNVVGLPLAALNELLTATGCCLICRQVAAAVST